MRKTGSVIFYTVIRNAAQEDDAQTRRATDQRAQKEMGRLREAIFEKLGVPEVFRTLA
jgi:hypothetical protein